MNMETIRTDVLVIGGGGAALRAAVEACDAGARVVLATKGTLGKSGVTALRGMSDISGLAAADSYEDPADNPESHLRDILTAGQGVADIELARTLAADAAGGMIPDLEKFGVEFERTEEGRYLVTRGCFASRARNYKLRGAGTKITDCLSAHVRQRDIAVLENTMAVDIVTEGGRAVGAVLMKADGAPVVVRSGAVVLATGGCGQLYRFNVNPADITGDGDAMGFRAGAELMNMEFMQMGLGMIPKPALFEFWFWAFRPKLTNGEGREFLQDHLPDGLTAEEVMRMHGTHFPFSKRLVSHHIELAVHREITAGRTSPHGGVFVDLRDCNERTDVSENAMKYWKITLEWLAQKGIDIMAGPLEISVIYHAINGGLRIGADAMTRVPGLYCAGENASGPHGADRLGGGMLSASQVFGRRAGLDAAARKNAPGADAAYEAAAAAFAAMAGGLTANKNGGHTPQSLRRELQDASTTYILLSRTEEGLNTYLQTVENIRKLWAADMRVDGSEDLLSALELRNLLQCGEIIARAARGRRESRGSHVRTDCPETDAEAKWMMVSKDSDGRAAVREVPVP